MTINYVGNQYQRLISKYQQANGLSFAKFAAAINSNLHPRKGFGKDHWYAVYRGTYAPDFYATWYLVEHGKGWVKDFALEMAAIVGIE